MESNTEKKEIHNNAYQNINRNDTKQNIKRTTRDDNDEMTATIQNFNSLIYNCYRIYAYVYMYISAYIVFYHYMRLLVFHSKNYVLHARSIFFDTQRISFYNCF